MGTENTPGKTPWIDVIHENADAMEPELGKMYKKVGIWSKSITA